MGKEEDRDHLVADGSSYGSNDLLSETEEFQQSPQKGTIPYPKSVFFILGTEACERFSYYGQRAILAIYLKDLFLRYSHLDDSAAEDRATLFYHGSVFLSYSTALIGAFLADSFLGKFNTIFYISIVYAIGQVTLALGSVPDSPQGIPGMPQELVTYLGLLLIAFGTGGIKPCVVALGADQFQVPEQKRQMDSFFGVFYASINFGSMISTVLTPYFREMSCFGRDQCFPLAFGVPAVLMICAIVSFGLGRPGYKIAIPERNVVADFFKCIFEAITQKFRSSEERAHWMDFAVERFGSTFVSEVKAVLKVSVLFLMYPLFWALYDQQGSRWTFQAAHMDGKIGGSFRILPDQMQVVNAFLILAFIPLFDRVIYPGLAKCGLLKTPLQKIITGGCILACSFLISAGLESVLQETYPHPPVMNGQGDLGSARLAFYNGLSADEATRCDLDLVLSGLPGKMKDIRLQVKANETSAVKDKDDYELLPFLIPSKSSVNISATGTFSKTCNISSFDKMVLNIEAAQSLTVSLFSQKNQLIVYPSKNSDMVDKSQTGNPEVRFIYRFGSGPNNKTSIVMGTQDYRGHNDGTRVATFPIDNSEKLGDVAYQELDLASGDFKVCFDHLENGNNLTCVKENGKDKLLTFNYGGSYNIYLDEEEKGVFKAHLEEVTPPNSIHMLWLLPQYIVLTAGEVLFSITSLALAFTQAPESMKSVVQALFLLTTAFGDLIDIIAIASLTGVFSSQVYEFLFFAGLMFLDMFILALVARRYEYVDYTDKQH